jgi:hypothetical protein
MAVRAENHRSTGSQHLPGKLMDHCLVGGHIDPAVFLRAGQAKYMVVLIDGPSHGTETIMAIRQNIGHREFFKSGCPGCLQDTYKCNVMGCQFIKFNLQIFHITGGIVGGKDAIRHRPLRRFFFRYFNTGFILYRGRRIGCIWNQLRSIDQICAAII